MTGSTRSSTNQDTPRPSGNKNEKEEGHEASEGFLLLLLEVGERAFCYLEVDVWVADFCEELRGRGLQGVFRGQ